MGTIVRLVIASIILTTTSIPTYASGQASDPDLKVGGEFFVLRPTSFPTHAPRRASFDCAVAKTPIERLICADSHLSDLDLKMGVAFDEGTQQEMHGSLMADQRDWLKKRLTDCSVPAKGEVKATTVREMTACLIKMYEERIRFLSGEVLGDDPVCKIIDTHLQQRSYHLLPDQDAARWKASNLEYPNWFHSLEEADIPWRGGTTRAYRVTLCGTRDCSSVVVIDTEPHQPPVEKSDRIIDVTFYRKEDRFKRPIQPNHDGDEGIFIINDKTILVFHPSIFDMDYAYARYYEIQTGYLQKLCVAFSPRRTIVSH